MDKSEKYVLMCSKATEIQELRKVSCVEGDIFNSSNKIRVITGNRNILFGSDDVWLPRQDQLQEILFKDQQIKNLRIEDFIKFNGFVCSDCTIFDSLEKYWLTFVMKEKFNKVWSEEKQDWIVEE